MAKTIISDTLAVHHPYDRTRGRRSGAHPGKFIGATPEEDKAFDPSTQKWSAVSPMKVSNIHELHAGVVARAIAGDAYMTRSEPADTGLACYRCTALVKGSDLPAVKAVPMHPYHLDLDKWPNIMGFDPRVEGEAAWNWMRSVLGKEFANTKISAGWSSSCCIRTPTHHVPKTLSAKMWLMLDDPMDPPAAVAFSKRLDKVVKAFFLALHNDQGSETYLCPSLLPADGHMYVDPRVALVSQRIYIAAPKFASGVADPFASGGRYALLDGKRDMLRVSAVMKSLPELMTVRTQRVSKPAGGRPSANRMPKARSLSVTVPG